MTFPLILLNQFYIEPQEMKSILIAVFAGFLFGAYNYCIKLSAHLIHEILGAVILQVVAFILGAAVLIYLKWNQVPMTWTHQGLKWAIAAGVFVGLAEIFSFYVFSSGMKVSMGVPIIIGVTILTSVILGVVFSKELVTMQDLIGMLFISGGIALLVWNG